MELVDLMKAISQKSPPSYSIWFGPEQKILDIYLENVISIGYKPIRCSTVAYAVQQIGKKSLDKSSKVYIVTEDAEYKTQETKWEQVESQFKKTPHLLVIRYNKIDKNTKVYTRHKHCAIEFPHLSKEVLCGYILRDLPSLSDEQCTKLCSMCNDDYGRILLEIDKVKNYMEAKKCSDTIAFDLLVKQGAIYSEIGDITFDLTNAVLYGATDKSIKVLDEAKRKGEPAIVIATILYNGFRNMLAIQGLGKDKKGAGERTGLTGWQVKQAFDNIGGYNLQDLERNMLICQKVESGIKNGLIDEDIALEYLVLSCLK